MRIGIEVQRIFRKNKHGMEIAGLELIREIQKLDKTNEYILLARADEDRNCIRENANFRVQTFPSLTYADWEQVALPRQVKKLGIDLLHCTCNTGPVYSPVPLVLTLHDIIYLENLNFRGSSYQNFGNLYRRIVVPRVVAKSDLIITVSEFEKKLIRDRLQIPEEKIKVIYNGIHERFHQSADPVSLEEFRRKMALPERFMLFLGNKAPKKNTINVIRAYAKYVRQSQSPVPLVIADYDRNELLRFLESIDAGYCAQYLYFPGYIGPDSMPLLYQSSEFFLYPSLRESFGMPILEAMACGVPVMTSNTSSMPEVAGDAAFYVDPFSVEDICRGLMEINANSFPRDLYIEKGLGRTKLFSWEKAAKKILAIYQKDQITSMASL